jgi:hypothetical protein
VTINADWQIVLAQITEWEHAAALMKLFEYRRDVLCANDSPIDALETDGVPSERGLAAFLADHLNRFDGDGVWTYTDFYSPTRGMDATPEQVDDLVARCMRAGVELHHVPR